jgi:two-component system CheB/CheR fusion protein
VPRKRQKIPRDGKRASRRATRPARRPGPATGATSPRPALVVAGVGASAGGLEAFSQVLESLPAEPGLAIVLVQHLAPQHESALAFLLSGRTRLSVEQATEGMELGPNRVYVIPPNVQMGVRDGRLHLSPRPTDRSQYTPIDYFLRSLADAYHDRAVAVILSGTASDGTVGVREVKAAGGITIAQEPETAKYDGMPHAAIATGLVDLVLPPAEIAAQLVRIARHSLRPAIVEREPDSENVPAPADEHLEQIFTLLRSATGVDFRRYKRPTIERRLRRRMVLQRIDKLDQYLRLLHNQPEEVTALYQDILIRVTRFFRDPDLFAEIGAHVLPTIFEHRRDDVPIRIWVPGCATGEEAYSIAILTADFIGHRAGRIPVQIFATDVSEPAIEQARAGLYPGTIEQDVDPGRLRRFFVRVDGGYKVAKTVRDLCIFARQDLTRDPPFSNLDAIVCRNVLIYLGAEMQQRLMSIFHYALKPAGFLILGSAETIGLHAEFFAVADKKHRIYRKKTVTSPEPHLAFEYTPAGPMPGPERLEPSGREPARGVQAEVNRLIQERFAPPGVVIDDQLRVVQFRGQTGAFLEPAPGEPSLNILKMAREGLLHGLRAALADVRRSKRSVRRTDVRVKSNGAWQTIDLEVVPLASADRPHWLVLFWDRKAHRGRARRLAEVPRTTKEPVSKQVATLQQELKTSREYLQSIIQDLEAANEELQSANEEVLSANEELQSANEELDTAKEELQSTNEELNTLNEELHARNEELSRLNSDLMNLLASVPVAIVIVSGDLRIRRFTPMAERVLNLIATDVGRPIGHIKPNIDCPDLEELISRAIDGVMPVERDVSDGHGNWFSLRVRPYKSVENRIDGAVLTLFANEAVHREDAERRAREYAEAIVQTVREPLVVMDGALTVQTVNKAFCDTFRVSAEETEGRPLYELGDGPWNIPALRHQLEAISRDHAGFTDFQVAHDFPNLGPKRMVLNARRIDAEDGREALILLAIEDVTDRGGERTTADPTGRHGDQEA